MGRHLQEIREELERLLVEQTENLRKQTFAGLTEENLRREYELLHRIREVSAEYLAAIKNR